MAPAVAGVVLAEADGEAEGLIEAEGDGPPGPAGARKPAADELETVGLGLAATGATPGLIQ